MGVPYTFGTATTSIPLSQLDANFNTPVTLGNTTVGLGNTVTSVGNLTLTNVTITSGTINASVVDSGYTANAVIYANSTGVLTDGSANLTFNGTTLTASAATVTGAFAANGGTTLGDASGDALTINSSAVSIPNGLNFDSNTFVIDATNNRVGVGVASPAQALSVLGNIFGRTSSASNANNDFRLLAGAYTGNAGTIVTYNGTSGSNEINYGGGTGLGEPATTHIFLTGTAGSLGSGTERMRITSGGNVGIGTASPSAPLQVTRNWVSGYGQLALQTTGAGSLAGLNFYDTTTRGGGVWQNYSSANELEINNILNAPTVFSTNNTERMRIDSSGNVGIGTSNPGYTLDVVQRTSDDSYALQLRGYTTGADGTRTVNIRTVSSNAGDWANFRMDASSFIWRHQGTTERMRITSGGEVYIAGTTDQGAYNLQVNGTGVWGAGAYVNGSDERIKDNIAPLDSGLDVVAKLNPVTYKYKEDWSKDQSTQTGFIAQELLTALEGKNYVDGVVQQGGEYMSVAYQNIIPILTKAIQEQQAQIEELKQEVAALKAK